MVLDAKAPTVALKKSGCAEQAYSYAIHPEVRCERYALCNGHRLVTYSISAWSPEVDIAIDGTEACWKSIMYALAPSELAKAPNDRYTAWFHLLGLVLSPLAPPQMAGDAAFRLSSHMPSVVDSRRAAVEAVMRNLSDAELLSVLRAGQFLFDCQDGSPAEHVGWLLSYDNGMRRRLVGMLKAQQIPGELECLVGQYVDFLDDEHQLPV